MNKEKIKEKLPTINLIWNILVCGIIMFNSFLILYRKNDISSMKYVIISFAFLFFICFIIEFAIKVSNKENNELFSITTKKIFKIIYTLVYLTIIMIHLIQNGLFDNPNKEILKNCYNDILLFIVIVLWGTNFLWYKKIKQIILSKLKR